MPIRRLLLVGAILATGAGVAGVAWRMNRHADLPKNFGVVEPGRIYRSGQPTLDNLRAAHDTYGFRTIVHLGGDRPDDPQAIAERELAAELGATWLGVPLQGNGTGDPDVYVQVVDMMRDPDHHPILVHCGAGAQRTSAAVILYKHIVLGEAISDVYPESFEYRHEADEWPLLAYIADNVEGIRAGLGELDTAAETPTETGAADEPDAEPAQP